MGDKGYTGQPVRSYLRRRGIRAVIPRRANESRCGVRFDRAIATRYEKLAITYHALVTIACILLWL